MTRRERIIDAIQVFAGLSFIILNAVVSGVNSWECLIVSVMWGLVIGSIICRWILVWKWDR